MWGQAQMMLQMQFMQSFTTGNLILDTLGKGAIVTLTTAAFFYMQNLTTNLRFYLEKILKSLGIDNGWNELIFRCPMINTS